MACWVLIGSWLGDNDFEDCWLNHELHPSLQKYCGIDISVLFPEMKRHGAQMLIGVWIRNAIDLFSLPFNSIQSIIIAKNIIIGDRKDVKNPFHWNKLEESLPFSESYKASLPKLRKVRLDGRHGSEIVIYVDDVRIVACSVDIAWLYSSRVAKRLCWLGFQDAARKRRRPSRNPGAWAGTVVSSDGDVVTKNMTQERWDKTKEKLLWIAKQGGITDGFTPFEFEFEGIQGNVASTDPVKIQFKTSESIVGFIVYVAQTYSSFVPYLKGIYLI